MPSFKSRLTKFVTGISPFFKNKISLIYSYFRNRSITKKQKTKQKTKITLTYRGIKYEYNPTIVEIIEEKKEYKYRGIPWRVRTIKQPFKLEPKKELSYRGHPYQRFRLVFIENPSPTDNNKTENQIQITNGKSKKESESSTKDRNYPQPLNSENPENNLFPNPYSDPNPEPIIPTLVLDKDIFKDEQISSSGEGEIWTTKKYNYRTKYLIKIYHQETTSARIKRIKKLEVMLAYPPKNCGTSQQVLAWPEYLLADKEGEIIGFVMEFI